MQTEHAVAMFGRGSWTELATDLHHWWIASNENVLRMTSFILNGADRAALNTTEVPTEAACWWIPSQVEIKQPARLRD